MKEGRLAPLRKVLWVVSLERDEETTSRELVCTVCPNSAV
jgi:hypothetical protein